KMGYLRFYLAPKIEEDEEMNGHHIDLGYDEEELKPKVATNGNNDYVEVVGSKPGTGIVKPEEEIKEETNGEAEVMEVK
ncbi:hypothetical protein Tco_0765068, partial [Tanacetum coccineum]